MICTRFSYVVIRPPEYIADPRIMNGAAEGRLDEDAICSLLASKEKKQPFSSSNIHLVSFYYFESDSVPSGTRYWYDWTNVKKWK